MRGRNYMGKGQKYRNNRTGGMKASGKVAAILIPVLVVVAIAALLITNSGIIHRSRTAVTIGEEKYSTSVVRLYYRFAYNQFVNMYGDYTSAFGLDTSLPLDEQIYDEEEGTTWADHFLDSGIDNMQQVIILSSEARKEGFTLSEEGQAALQESKDQITAYCVANNITKGTYFGSFGAGVTEKIYYEQMENMQLADEYSKHMLEQMEPTDADVQTYYDENKNDFDLVDYRSFFFNGTPETETDEEGNAIEATEEEKTAAMEAASEQANEMLGRLEAGGVFSEVAKQYAAEGDETYEDESATLSEGTSNSAVSSYKYGEWLFDADRAEGDLTVSEESNGYYVLQYLGREREEYATRNVRQILIEAEKDEETGEATDEQKAAAKEEADGILAEWNQGAKTEDSFAELANAYLAKDSDAEETEEAETQETEDTAADDSEETGGLYSQANKNTFVSEVRDWLFSEEREAGDVDMIETSNGDCYVLYYVGEDEPYWKVRAAEAKKNDDYSSWLEEKKEEYPVERNEAGLKAVQ